MSGRAECNCVEQNGKPFNAEGNRSRERHIGPVWDFYSYAHITLFRPSNTATRKLAWTTAVRLDGTARTPTSHSHTHALTPTDTRTLERTMVVQGAVTPGRTRRLMLKLPVGTLRRNSAERVRDELPSVNLFHFSPSFFDFMSVWQYFLFVCKWDLKKGSWLIQRTILDLSWCKASQEQSF